MPDLLQYDFMVRALLAGLMVGIICPAIGVFLVMRRFAFMADTLAHVSLAGVALGMLLQVVPAVTTLGTSMLAAVGIERLRSREKLYSEAVLALVMSGGLALAVVLISLAKGFSVDLFSYLFGSILTVTNQDLWVALLLGSVVLLALILLYKELFMIAFDEESARVAGLPVGPLNLVFIILIAVTVSIAMRIVGTLLVSALMVIPVITAMLLARSFKQTFWSAIGYGVLAVVFGLVASFYLDIASGGAIVLTAALSFAVTYLVKSGQKAIHRKRISGGSLSDVETAAAAEKS